MQTLALLTSIFAVLTLWVAKLGIAKAQSPSAAYAAAILGVAATCVLVASTITFALVSS